MKIQKNGKNNKKWYYIFGIGILAFFMVYIGIAFFFMNHFFWKTLINGYDFSGKTVEYVEEDIKKQLKDYTLSIYGREGIKDAIKGEDISLTYQRKEELDNILKKQNAFLWPEFIFKKKTYNIVDEVFYDEERLFQKINSLSFLTSDQSLPQSAYLEFNGDEFVVHPETDGTAVDQETLKKKISLAIMQLDSEINLEEEGCYVMPEYTLDSEELQHTCQEANGYCQASITYLMDEPVVIDKKIISNWLSVEDNFSVKLDERAIKQWLEDFGDKYNTIGITRNFTTPTGKNTTVTGGTYGWSIDEETEFVNILTIIKNGDVITKEPAYYPGGMAAVHAMPDWGDTYAEVDLSEQHMWYISNGTVLLDTDVVTGETIPEKITPEGSYSLLEKDIKVVLKGDIVPETGEPEYLQPVNYWMRITWEGIGFHDATWQSAFGGSLNQITGIGSHGCVNMPLDQAAALYNMIEIGTPVIIHY